jgi:hypothetical protein
MGCAGGNRYIELTCKPHSISLITENKHVGFKGSMGAALRQAGQGGMKGVQGGMSETRDANNLGNNTQGNEPRGQACACGDKHVLVETRSLATH